MNDLHGKRGRGADLLGLLLFGAGAFPAALVSWAIYQGPAEAPAGTAALAAAILSGLGHGPALLLSVSCAILGARMFLEGKTQRVLLNLSGVVGTSIGLAVLLGAFSETAGGVVGASTGGALASVITVVPAAILGLAVVLVPIWLAWLRDFDLLSTKKRKTNPPQSALTDEPMGGVSAEEAAALLPAPEEQNESLRAIDDHTEALYPQDARLEGRIPEGAKPLPASDVQEEPASPLSGSAVPSWTPGGAASPADSADGDLAGDGDGAEATETPPLFESKAPPEPAGTGAGSSEQQPALEVRAETPEPEVALAETPAGTTVVPAAALPRPLWEQDDLFEKEEVSDGEEAAAAALASASVSEEEEEEETEDLAAELEDEDEEEEEEEEEDAEDLAAELEDEDDEEPEGEDESEDLAAELEDEDEDEEDEEYEYEYVEVAEGEEGYDDAEEIEEDDPVITSASATSEGEDEEAEASLAEAEESAEAPEVPTAPGRADDIEEATEVAEHAAGEAEPVAEPVARGSAEEEPVPDEVVAESARVQMDLFADPAETVADQAAEETPEPVMVLEPQAPPASGNAQEVARLILEEDRVAVSMVQRKLGMDFTDSCAVLDELQGLGLIGPYVDGKSRDILMTREEWLAAAGD